MKKTGQSAHPESNDQPDPEQGDDAVIGRAFWGSIGVLLVIGLAAGGYWLWNNANRTRDAGKQQSPATPAAKRELPAVELPQVRFTDITDESGIDFVHENGGLGERLLPETMGSGCAFFDYDNDADPDILFVNSNHWPWDTRETEPATLTLYNNDGNGNFTDATDQSGLGISLYGQGVAVGDYDNDGHVDVFVSALGPNRLFRNRGNGTFEDVTASAGVAGDDSRWSTSCGWVDFDNDGDLDLFVCNYLDWSRETHLPFEFTLAGGEHLSYGRPEVFPGTFPYLYVNDGTGRFTEKSEKTGLHVRNPATREPLAKALGVTFDYLNNDPWPDIVIANDTVQNLLFINEASLDFTDRFFMEQAAESGVAFDSNGLARAGMGIDASRFRNNDEVGIAIGNLSNEMTALFVARNELSFTDEAISNGLGPATRPALTFGLFFFDSDLDGRLDLFAANGHLEKDINLVQSSQHFAQPPQLFWNCGPQYETEFVELPAEKCGDDLARPMVGRGATYADIDADGDLDILVSATGGSPRLLRNDQQTGNHWLRFKLTGDKSNRDAIGAVVEVTRNDGTRLRQMVMPTRSYLSQVELPVTFGLNGDTGVQSVRIRWPSGKTTELTDPAIDQVHHVDETQGLVSAGQ